MSDNHIKQKRKNRWKERPANEISEQEVSEVLLAIKTSSGYPKLRDIANHVPSLDTFKLNLIIRFLEKSGSIVIDGDGYIIWTRENKPKMSSLSEAAELSPEFKAFLEKNPG